MQSGAQGAFAKGDRACYGQVVEEMIGGKSYSVSREVIKAKPEQIWQVLTDFANAPHVFPQMKKCELIEERANGTKLVKNIVAPSGVIGSYQYVLEMRETAPRMIEWHRVSGDFKEVEGFWKLEPVDGGHHTMVTYSCHVAGGFLLPGALIRRQSRIDMPQVMAALRNSTESSAPMIAGKPHDSLRNQ